MEDTNNGNVPAMPIPQAGENGSPVPPMPNPGEALAEGLSAMTMGSPDYSKVFEKQMDLFTRFSENIDKLDENIAIVNDDLENTKSTINELKLYTKLLTWGLFISDIIFTIVIMLILILK